MSSAALLTALSAILVAGITAFATTAVGRNARMSQRDNMLTEQAKAYLDAALRHAQSEIEDLRERVRAAESEIRTLRSENADLRLTIHDRDQEIERLRGQPTI